MATTTPTPAQLAADMTALMEGWRVYTTQLQNWLGGTVTGGPNSDGKYPLTDYKGNTFMVPCPALEASRVDGEVNSASSFADAAQASAEAAVNNVTNAKLAQDAADDFANAAKAARDLAKMYADVAGTNAANALSYSNAASASAAAAAQSASNAAASLDTLNEAVSAAQDSADAALASQNAAATSETNAAASAADALASQNKAHTSAVNSQTAQAAAETAQAAAEASQSAAAGSASAAAGSASASATSATAAKASQTAAATSATNAKTSETNAASSKTAAASSATAAATSASNAKTSETNAASSASAAAGSASDSQDSADASAASATAAASSASAAKTSQTAAATSATNAKTSETNAASSKTAAATSATNAAASATAAASSASAASDSEDAALASQKAAATSATAAAASQSAAKTSETNAASSKTAAASSASAAATSATNAKTSETNAASSKTAAAASQTAAKTSETNAAASASAAKTSQTAAASSATAAATSASNAKTSETNAAASAAAAKTFEPANFAPIDNLSGNYHLSGTGLAAGTSRFLEIGTGRTTDGSAYVDLIGDGTYTDYGTRLIRGSGATGTTTLAHQGTGNFIFNHQGGGTITFQQKGSTKVSISSSGAVVGSTTIQASGAMYVKPTSTTGNANFVVKDYAANNRGILLFNGSDESMRLRKMNTDGTVQSDLVFDNLGGLTYTGNYTVQGSIAASLGSSYGFASLVPGTADKPGYAEFRLADGTRAGYIGWYDVTIDGKDAMTITGDSGRAIKMSTDAGVYSNNMYWTSSAAGGYGYTGRDDGQSWITYVTGNRWRLWNAQVGDVLQMGAGGDLWVGYGGGGTINIGDDAKLIDVGVAYTLGLKAQGGGANAFLNFGDTSVTIGSSGGIGYINSGTTKGLGTEATGSILHTGWFDTYNYVGDYNNLTRSGVYRINDGNSNSNFPSQASYGQMWVSSGGAGDTTVQIAVGYNSNHNSGQGMYWRGASSNGTSWGSWRTVWDSDNLIVSSGDPGYIEGRIWIQV